jgi:hypothetical protein
LNGEEGILEKIFLIRRWKRLIDAIDKYEYSEEWIAQSSKISG